MLIPTGGIDGWKGYETDTLQDLLEGFLFFRDEPALPDPVFEKAVEEMVNAVPQKGVEPKPAASSPKGKPIDVGKIHALSKAGWTQKKIADEMKLSPSTVNKYLRQEDGKYETGEVVPGTTC